MTLQSKWDGTDYEYNDVWGYVDNDGKEYAIIGSKTQIHFLDISNPELPFLIAEFALGSNTSWRDIKTFGHYAYAVSEGTSKEGLVIFDLCRIGERVIKKVYQKNDVFGKAHNIFIDPKKEILYIVGADSEYNGVINFDLSSDPANPNLIRKISLPGGPVHDIFVKDDIAFCSHGNNGLYVYDISNPNQFIAKALLSTGGFNHSTWGIQDSLLVYAQEVPLGLPLGIIDYTNYLSNDLDIVKTFKMPLLGEGHTKNTPHNPYMVGNYAVVSYYEDGVVIFDLSDPLQPDTVAYYDTYVNETYTGYKGCWGVYPFLPSGNILASDISNGLFVLKPNFDLPTNCGNGQQDWNEENIDCGGVCKFCTPCIREICNNGIDDDRNGKTDCMDEACDCLGNETRIEAKVILEGFFDASSGLMNADLKENELLPMFQPFKTAPFFYTGRETIRQVPSNVTDWVLVEARHPEKLDSVLSKKACLLLNDGHIVEADTTLGFRFDDINSAAIHLVVRHKGHLAVLSRSSISLTDSTTVQYDFSKSLTSAMGSDQLKLIGNYFCQFAGDFDQNGIINSLDYNIWKQNSALINRYLFWDADGNGVINNLDFNFWKVNRSIIGAPSIFIK